MLATILKIIIAAVMLVESENNISQDQILSSDDFPGTIRLTVYPPNDTPYENGPHNRGGIIFFDPLRDRNDCQFVYIEDLTKTFFILLIVIDELLPSTEDSVWFLNKIIDISFVVDGIPVVSLSNYRFVAGERYEGSSLSSAVEVCFQSNFITDQHAYKLEFTNEQGEEYIYKWGIVERYPQILE